METPRSTSKYGSLNLLQRVSSDSCILNIRDKPTTESTNLIRRASYSNVLGHADLHLASVINLGGDHQHHDLDNNEHLNFVYNYTGLTSIEAQLLLKEYGRNELPEKHIPMWYIFFSLLRQPMPIMIWFAIIIEAAIENWADFGILLFIQFANATIGFYETIKADDAVSALKKTLKPEATVKRDGTFKKINAALVVPGDTVLLVSGSAVPADCRVNHGDIDVDQSQLTGESLSINMHKGDSAKMGSTVVRGEVEGTVLFTGSQVSTKLPFISLTAS